MLHDDVPIELLIWKRRDLVLRQMHVECKSHRRLAAVRSSRLISYRFVTTLKAQRDAKGNKKNATMQLIRSYDCDRADGDSRRTTQRSRSTHSKIDGHFQNRARVFPLMKAGRADNFKIWEVARAATAAPYYFDPIEIKDGDNIINVFEDGGLGETTNPTEDGIDDIAIQEGHDAVGIVVSVGTARGQLGHEKDFILGKTKDKFKGTIWNASDPERVHARVERKQDSGHYRNMKYWRLNPTTEDHLLDMALDAWKPKRSPRLKRVPGSRTINDIKNAFSKWASQTDVQNELRECARQLVEQRRRRMQDEVKWERFSTLADYRCRLRPCELKHRTFTNLKDFVEHLKDDHEITREDVIKEYKNKWSRCWRYQKPAK